MCAVPRQVRAVHACAVRLNAGADRAEQSMKRFWKDVEDECEVEIRRVLGHAGDPLNRAADQIAFVLDVVPGLLETRPRT